ncbi:MAG: FAD-dependent oxidoreductase [Bdellovibrionales bacterium]|nr:FAD-dependent oxidoreductase [Bdellovibrionales bacterium]
MSQYDFNVIVIGGGSGGLVASLTASTLKAKVLLIEKHKMGGDCLNTGCVPSKTLLSSARRVYEIKNAGKLGIKNSSCDFEFSHIMERVQSVIKQIAPKDSKERYEQMGVKCVEGEAHFEGLNSVRAAGQSFTARSFIIAAGSSPFVPPIKGLNLVDYLTSDTLWNLREKPKKMVIIGGGPIGLEMAQGLNRLGVPVTLVESASRIMGKEDSDVSQWIGDKLKSEGMEILTSVKIEEIKKENGNGVLHFRHQLKNKQIPFSHLLIATGRKANLRGLGLEGLEVRLTKLSTIETNGFMATNHPHIYACGDITGPYFFTHTAAYQGTLAAIHALFSPFSRLPFLKLKATYDGIPWCIYTDPEVARCGHNEITAQEKNIPFEVTYLPLKELDRALTDGKEEGFIKVLTKKGSDKILGMTAVGSDAGQWTGGLILAINQGIGLNQILKTVHAYPTLTEIAPKAAALWKKRHISKATFQILQKFHQWRL